MAKLKEGGTLKIKNIDVAIKIIHKYFPRFDIKLLSTDIKIILNQARMLLFLLMQSCKSDGETSCVSTKVRSILLGCIEDFNVQLMIYLFLSA